MQEARHPLPVHELGGDGPPLVVLHATGFAGEMYELLAPALAAGGFRVLAPDLRGHGASPRPADGVFSWHAMARDVAAWLDDLGERVHVLGHSMGGAVGLLTAVLRPDAVTAVYAYEPSAVRPGPEGAAGAKVATADAVRRRRATFASHAVAREVLGGKPPFAAMRADGLEAYVRHAFAPAPDGTVVLRCAPADEAATYLANDVEPAELAGLPVPVAFAHGAGGEYGGVLVPPAAAEALPGAPVHAHPDLGHFGPFQAPERIAAQALAAFGA